MVHTVSLFSKLVLLNQEVLKPLLIEKKASLPTISLFTMVTSM